MSGDTTISHSPTRKAYSVSANLEKLEYALIETSSFYFLPSMGFTSLLWEEF